MPSKMSSDRRIGGGMVGGLTTEKNRVTPPREAAAEEGEAANELKTIADDETDETRSSRSPTHIPASSGGR